MLRVGMSASKCLHRTPKRQIRKEWVLKTIGIILDHEKSTQQIEPVSVFFPDEAFSSSCIICLNKSKSTVLFIGIEIIFSMGTWALSIGCKQKKNRNIPVGWHRWEGEVWLWLLWREKFYNISLEVMIRFELRLHVCSKWVSGAELSSAIYSLIHNSSESHKWYRLHREWQGIQTMPALSRSASSVPLSL